MKYYLPLLLFCLSFVACKNQKDIADNSQNALDWAGRYQGNLPCADCPGIQTDLELKEDGSYTLRYRYQDRSDSVYTESGKLKWGKKGQQITLEGKEKPNQYQLEEGALRQLDLKGKPVEGELAERYLLKRPEESPLNKYWKLVELNGQAIKTPKGARKEIHFILKANGQLQAHGGCNSVSGNYKLQEEQKRIQFTGLMSTKMACPNLGKEQEFLKVLGSVDNYSISGDKLSLQKAKMAPQARFEAVYFY